MLSISLTPSSSNTQLRTYFQSIFQTTIATNPNEIADLLITFFASVFTTESIPVEHSNKTNNPVLTDLNLSKQEVEILLNSLDTNKATASDEIPARNLKKPPQ